MHRALFALMLSALLPSPLVAATINLPLSAAELQRYLDTQQEPSLVGLLADLPPSLRENFVLMQQTQSLQQATPEAPRQILFGADARFLLAVSGIPTDPRYQILEFAEFEPATGVYHFGTVDFSGSGRPVVKRDVAFCAGCHGRPTRPIWGVYPDWHGAYGDEHGVVAPDLKAAWAGFVEASDTAPRYRHLVFQKDPSGGTFKLSARYYGYPNTDFNHELGNTVALGTITRARQSPNFARGRYAVLATSPGVGCIASDRWSELVRQVQAAYAGIQDRYPPTSRVDVKAWRLLGIDPVLDFSLEQFGGSPTGSAGQYQTGAYRIEEALAFQLLLDVMATDAPLKQAFAKESEQVAYIAEKSQLVGAQRAAALRRSSSWFLFFDVFDPVAASRSRLDAVCGRLTELFAD